MTTQSAAELTTKKCQPCEGGVEAVPVAQAAAQVAALPGWKLSSDGKLIRKEWRLKDFSAGIDFFQRVADVANAEDHHPDLHLTGYRNVAIELTTHAIKGLSENDFILAAKIDALPVELKSK
jgi:4a-hydroxytetrahydrobiopterin dehydratase